MSSRAHSSSRNTNVLVELVRVPARSWMTQRSLSQMPVRAGGFAVWRFALDKQESSAHRKHVVNDHATSYQTAIRRTGPPVAPVTFAAPTKTVAPTGGTCRRLATSSTPHLPVASQAL